MHGFLRSIQNSLGKSIQIPRHVYILIGILLIAFDLRIQSVTHSEVDTPIRADAREYVLYAYNLKTYGVYSSTDTFVVNGNLKPVPDAKRAPLYPIFLLPYLSNPPTHANISAILWAQSLISTFTVLLVFWIARRYLSIPFALIASGLTAISPHLVTMNIYLLSETLLCFFIVLSALLVVTMRNNSSITFCVLVGLVVSAAALTHPMMTYLIIPLLLYLLYVWGWLAAWKKVLAVFLGFTILYGGWIARNITTLGVPGDSTLMLAALRVGAYQNMMYQNNPQTFGYPYRYDPQFENTSKDFASVLMEIKSKFESEPLNQFKWYLIGKPISLWSWNNVEGPGDVFIYPVRSSPYRYLPQFKITHYFMHATHWLLVLLMVGGICLAWIPGTITGIPNSSLYILRILSILLLYHCAVMIAGFPLPRYAIPLRPFLYLVSLVPLSFVIERFRHRRQVQTVGNEP